MNIGFVTLGMGRAPLDEVLGAARAVGCEVMELNGRATVHQNLWQQPLDPKAIKAKIAASGVRPTSLGGYSNFAQATDIALAEQVDQLVGYCRLAREMCIPIVRAFAGDVSDGTTLDKLYPRIVQGFAAVTAHVSDWGLKIGIENHGHLVNDGPTIRSLLDDVGSPILGLTLDTGNFCWAGHSIDAAHDYVDMLAPRVFNVHVKDGKFVDGVWTLEPAGRGDIDLPGILVLLRSLGYAGPVLSEYEGPADFQSATIESVAYLRGLRDALER